MKIKIILLLLIMSKPVFSEEVKVGIVGYTLLDNFKIICNESSQIRVDGDLLKDREFIITSDGVLNTKEKEYIFDEISIKSESITTFLSSKGEQPYLGDFIITYNDNLSIVNIIARENYLSSVLGSEMGAGFETEALKAQLLCIKNFLSIRTIRNKNKSWDILNTARVMAYRGEEYSTEKMLSIVRELNNTNLVLKNNIEPLFFSTASGYLLNQSCLTSTMEHPPEHPIIQYDNNITSPYYSFSHEMSENELIEIINKDLPINSISKIILKEFTGTDCIDFIGFTNRYNKTYWLKAYRFVSLIQRKYGGDFQSIQFSVYKENEYFYFSGKGFGHFIGMSQYGAQEMALNGKTYKEILKFYFPTSELR